MMYHYSIILSILAPLVSPNVTVTILSTTSFKADWTALSTEQSRGIVLGYSITLLVPEANIDMSEIVTATTYTKTGIGIHYTRL